jgi:hypothetical protein
MAPAIGITDPGRPELTRIFASTDEGYRFVCTASYVFPYVNDSIAWVLTAGHCTQGDTLSRNQSENVRAVVNWRMVINNHGEHGTQTIDLALGTAPDVRDVKKKLWLADKAPDQGRVYIHGFPEGVESVTTAYVAPAFANERVSALIQYLTPYGPDVARKTIAEMFPGTRLMFVKAGIMQPGSSGSPVLDAYDRVIGVAWGLMPYSEKLEIEGVPRALQGMDLVMFTPIERVHELFKFNQTGE